MHKNFWSLHMDLYPRIVTLMGQDQDRKYSTTAFPHLTVPLYMHIPGALPFPRPSIASATSGPLPSSLSCFAGYMYVLKEKRIARVCGSRVRVWSSTRIKVVDMSMVLSSGVKSSVEWMWLLAQLNSSASVWKDHWFREDTSVD